MNEENIQQLHHLNSDLYGLDNHVPNDLSKNEASSIIVRQQSSERGSSHSGAAHLGQVDRQSFKRPLKTPQISKPPAPIPAGGSVSAGQSSEQILRRRTSRASIQDQQSDKNQ